MHVYTVHTREHDLVLVEIGSAMHHMGHNTHSEKSNGTNIIYRTFLFAIGP